MKLKRIDIISILDLRFKRAQVSRLERPATESANTSPIVARLKESYSWLFYGEQLQDFELVDISSLVPNTNGAAVRINRRLGTGTCIVWRTYPGDSDPPALKSKVWDGIDEDFSH